MSQAAARRVLAGSRPAYDVVLIGAGVIGSSCALQLARKGFRTLNIDKGPAAGSGSTSYSSGNLRTMYTALTSTKFADEGYRFWQSWPEQLQAADDRGFATFRKCGGGVIWTEAAAEFLDKCYANHDQLGLPYEVWDRAELKRRMPVFDLTSYHPPRRIDDPDFGTPSDSHRVHGAGYFPNSGYVSDPMLGAGNLAAAAQATGNATFMFNSEVKSIDKRSGRISGLTLGCGQQIAAPVVVNVAGPHSAQITSLAFSGEFSELNDMNVMTRPMRQEVAHVESMPEWSYEKGGMTFADFDVGVYWRPEVGGKILIGSIEPECDVEHYMYPQDADSCEYHAEPNAIRLSCNLFGRTFACIPHFRMFANTLHGPVMDSRNS
jgi:sarcosine oxidase subunit beta